jgi:NAD(P)H dehydrogenase (quinone)
MAMSKIVVTGATGELGKLVIQHLLTKVAATQIAVSVRNTQKAAGFADQGIEVRFGDYVRSCIFGKVFHWSI